MAALTTVTPDPYPQTSVVWCDFDGQCLRVNTMRGFVKERNMRRNPGVTLLCCDPRRLLRYLEVRGMIVKMTEAGAAGHLDCLASKYAGRPVRFFGDAIPASFAETETPVLCRIRPAYVVALDATGPARRDGQDSKHTTGPTAPGTLPVPASHLDLLTRSICGVFTTLGRDGQPRSTLVWVDQDRGCAPLLYVQELGDGAGRRPRSAQKDHSGAAQGTTLTTGPTCISGRRAVINRASGRWPPSNGPIRERPQPYVSVCRTNPDQGFGTRRSRTAGQQESQI